MLYNKLLNVIIRIHNTEERSLKSLSFCLFTLFGQDYVPLQPVICCQNFNQEQLDQIKLVVDESLWDNKETEKPLFPFYPIIHNVVLDKAGDFRSMLLNEGINLSTGRYLAFLDYDDLIYGHAYRYLIDRLNKKGVAISFGDIKRTDASYFDGYFYQHKKLTPFGNHSKNLHDLFVDNFCPIHSFVIDKSKIDKADLYFDHSLTITEDYHFLLRFTAKYKSDFSGRSRFVGEYLIRTDGSNTSPFYHRESDDSQVEWQNNVNYLNEFKKSISAPVISVAEVALLKKSSYQTTELAHEINKLKETLFVERKNVELINKLLSI